MEKPLAIVETERHGGVFVVRMNRPERLNALSVELREGLADAWTAFEQDDGLQVGILTGNGRAFCAGGDLKRQAETGTINMTNSAPPSLRQSGAAAERPTINDPYYDGTLMKPVIAAINGYAMGGGFAMAERADLRIAVRGAILELSEAKRWLLGGYRHGHINKLPHAIATEMAFAYRFSAERLYELGYINWLVDDVEELIPAAIERANHLLTLPPAALVNTMVMMRELRPRVPGEYDELGDLMKGHGAIEDLHESRRAFAEKRAPNWKGWDDPGDRLRTPTLGSLRSDAGRPSSGA